MELVDDDDGARRCAWGSEPTDYRHYHDTEWGFGEASDERLFEKICLEGFQAGLSWLTILRKRDRFREVFAGFEPATVALYDDHAVARLLADPGIVRHEGKIRSTVNNARRAIEMIDHHGSLAAFFWPHAVFGAEPPVTVPATTDTSVALSKQLKQLGWSFVGPTTIYAFMQAMGLVNDHLDGCHVREQSERSRVRVAASIGLAS